MEHNSTLTEGPPTNRMSLEHKQKGGVMDAILERIAELENRKKQLEEKLSKKWDEVSGGESFNCGNVEISNFNIEIDRLNRSLETLYALRDGELVISESQKNAIENVIEQSEKKLSEILIHLSDAKVARNNFLFATALVRFGFNSHCNYDLTVCDCECHKNPDLKIQHFVPCCTDVCPKCGKHILFGLLEAHQKCCCK